MQSFDCTWYVHENMENAQNHLTVKPWKSHRSTVNYWERLNIAVI